MTTSAENDAARVLAENVRAVLRLISPEHITPLGKRQVERVLDEYAHPVPRAILCNDIEALVEAEERGETVECEHVCGDALRHAGPLDDLIASLAADPTDETIRQALWEDAVERGEPWATDDTRVFPPGVAGP